MVFSIVSCCAKRFHCITLVTFTCFNIQHCFSLSVASNDHRNEFYKMFAYLALSLGGSKFNLCKCNLFFQFPFFLQFHRLLRECDPSNIEQCHYKNQMQIRTTWMEDSTVSFFFAGLTFRLESIVAKSISSSPRV